MNVLDKIREYFIKKKLKDEKYELGILDKKTNYWKPMLLLIPSIFIVLLFTFFPLIYASITSFTYLPNPNNASIREAGWKNFELVLKDELFAVGVRNSLIYGFLALPITLTISIIISTAISTLYKKWARGFWQTIFFLPYITSAVAVSIAFAYMFDNGVGIVNRSLGINTKWLKSGVYDSYLPLVVLLINGVWKGLAFQILMITTAMLGVDKTLYKAASIDGASKTKQFFRITLPSITKTLNFLVTMGILGGIKVFPLALFNNNPTEAKVNGGMTIMLMIYDFIKQGASGLAGATTIYLFLLGVAMSVILKRGIKFVIIIINKIGEKNVLNTIKNTKLIL
ncbi:carbohydrate ABC transporter permease [Mesomycoplasma lagogenitalium]|uniref:Sugar ABC transporter permease n=1 Tax=Mesomycoplasma lagogenitalium TaxID=171286 RepID=A0ABY8LVG8_9BACT|nr:sugar ABC transporter permease [Mesomycoplasma lagogenitalium]WGI36765.1 sugar ABC transporter permease [Mesomycoplasma lagogenitalium]